MPPPPTKLPAEVELPEMVQPLTVTVLRKETWIPPALPLAGVGQRTDRQTDLRGQPAIFQPLQSRAKAGGRAAVGPGLRTPVRRPLWKQEGEPHDPSPFGCWSALRGYCPRRAGRAPGRCGV